jgi:putative oxidoreductase
MKTILRPLASFLLILLFVYAAVSKLLSPVDFQGELYNQTFPHWLADILLYTLIPAELLTVALLSFPRSQQAGLLLSTGLLALFSGYITLVLLRFWDRVPCSCGGILKHLTWGTHLVFNLFFLALNLAALFRRPAHIASHRSTIPNGGKPKTREQSRHI